VVDVVDREAYHRAKVLEQQQRHTKYNETPYSLEPNVKESPGGLRDLHVVLWIARAAGYGTHWSELARRGLLTPAEANIIRLSERRVKEIRARLHLVTGRREDRLVFDVQNAVAQQAGFQPTAGKRASELLMQHYYRAAKVITQMNTAVLLNIEQRMLHRDDEPGVAIDATFVARGELLDIEDEAALARDPNGILRAFLLKAQRACRSTARTAATRATARPSSSCSSSRRACCTSCAG
jgi:[protein-PII] uridylyltransferase